MRHGLPKMACSSRGGGNHWLQGADRRQVISRGELVSRGCVRDLQQADIRGCVKHQLERERRPHSGPTRRLLGGLLVFGESAPASCLLVPLERSPPSRRWHLARDVRCAVGLAAGEAPGRGPGSEPSAGIRRCRIQPMPHKGQHQQQGRSDLPCARRSVLRRHGDRHCEG